MRVALFVPCYVDQFFPRAAWATVELLRRHGCTVEVPPGQTCCGQPLVNSGFVREAQAAISRHLDLFDGYDAVVCPSGSCTSIVRHHGDHPDHPRCERQEAVRGRTYELCEFLHDVLQVERLEARCHHRVGLHQSCHGLRELRLGSCSERPGAVVADKVRKLLGLVEGLTLVPLERPDECCGFGGMFAVGEPDVSVAMGQDRLADHRRAGAEIVTATDWSCLMHLQGLAARREAGLRFVHVAEILNGDVP